MKLRLVWRSIAVLTLVVIWLAPIQHAGATTAFFYSGINGIQKNVWTSFTSNPRTVSYSPWGVAFQKYDGPRIKMRVFQCSNPSNVNPNEPIAPDADPPYDWIYPRPNNESPSALTFCLSVMSLGSNTYDSFEGNLDWDG